MSAASSSRHIARNGGTVDSMNFGFLEAHDKQIVRLGGLAERYFSSDPSTAIVK